jgi:hypothetical protein
MNQPTFRSAWESLRSFFLRDRISGGTVRALIREEENAVGYERNDIRARAKEWLIAHRSSLAPDDVLLAQEHFGYLLPAGWERG